MNTLTPWRRDCEIAVALALCAVFGLDPESDEALSFIRYTLQNGQNNAQGDTRADMVYITLSPVGDPATAWASTRAQADGLLVQTKTIPISCLLSFYGDHAEEYAEQAWSGLMLDTGYGSPRFIMREHRLIPVERPERPVSMPEPVGGVWRRRADLRLRLNRLQVDEIQFSPVGQAPEVGLDVSP